MAAHQASPSLVSSRQEHWSGLPFPSPMHESEVAQSCLTLHDPMDWSLPGSSIMGFSRQEYWSGVPLPSPIIMLANTFWTNTRHYSKLFSVINSVLMTTYKASTILQVPTCIYCTWATREPRKSQGVSTPSGKCSEVKNTLIGQRMNFCPRVHQQGTYWTFATTKVACCQKSIPFLSMNICMYKLIVCASN